MAINQVTETITVKTEERTWCITIDTPKNSDPTVTIHREIVKTAPDGSIISKEPIGMVKRSLSATSSQKFKIGNESYTTAEIAGVIAAIADVWREEDIVNEKVVKAAEEEAAKSIEAARIATMKEAADG